MALRQTIDALAAAESDEMDQAPFAPSAPAAPTGRGEPVLSAVERNVILLARRDPLGSLAPPGMIERVVAWVFGGRTGARRLADPRLEALRRAAVVTHHRHHLPDAVAAELRALGYGERRIRALETLATG